MTIDTLRNDQLTTLEENYVRAKRTEGGKYSLAEVRLEKLRRNPSPFDIREVARQIVELSRNSADGLLTYGELWSAFRPHDPWKGHKSLSIMSKTLGRVISYCIRNRLPILTVLVVQANNRRLSAAAIDAICKDCRDLGLDTGLDARAFVDQQVNVARALVLEQLPLEV